MCPPLPISALNKKQKPEASISDLLGYYASGDPYQALKSGQVMARAWAKTLSESDHESLVRSFIQQVIAAFWMKTMGEDIKKLTLPESQIPLAEVNLEDTVSTLANAIGMAAASIDIDESAHHLGNLYSSMLPESLRTSDGIFYTPPALAKRLISNAQSAGINWTSARILDPASGCGAFLVPIALKIKKELASLKSKTVIAHIKNHLHGMEKDWFAAWICEVLLESVFFKELVSSRQRLSGIIAIGDSLEAEIPKEAKRYDLVIGNPPYGKIKLNPAVRMRFSASLYGHANLYGMFTQLSLELARKNGVVALLTPTSYLSGEYFKNLRGYISRNAIPVEMDFVSFRKGVFEEVLQETMLAVYRKGCASEKSFNVNQIETSSGYGVKISPAGRFSLPDNSELPWILPKTPKQSPSVKKMLEFSSRLSDWGYKVSTGQLVWNRHKAQLQERHSRHTYPIIWAESITRDGEFFWKTDKKNHAPYFKFSLKDNSLLTTKSCILFQRTTAKEQHKRLIAAVIPQAFIDKYKGVIIENHINMIVPITSKPLVDQHVLSAFLNSYAVNEAFRSMSGSVAVSAYELESFPLPDATALAELSLAVTSTDEDAVKHSCDNLYNLK